MEPVAIKNKIKNTVDGLPIEKLKIALDFLEDLQRSDENETKALLNEAGFITAYRQAKKDIRSGNTVSWEDIKRDV